MKITSFTKIIRMENAQSILQGSSDMEKGAYLGAIASIATADRSATPEELEYLTALAESAGLSSEQKYAVIQAASEISDDDVIRCLDVLKNSELKYSLVTDVIAFAKTDNNYSEEEQKSVQKMADYLGVNHQQFSLLDHFTDKAKEASSSTASPEEDQQGKSSDFLSSIGLKDKLQNAGINGSSLLKGLLGIAAPMVLANIVSRGLNRNRSYGGGMFGGGSGMLGGGLGSLFSILGGGRGFGSSGGLLSRIF